MSDLFTAGQLDALEQSIRGERVKIEILDFNNKVLDSIEGDCVSASINIEGSSLYRTSCNLDIIIDDLFSTIISDKYSVERGGLVWIDKYIKIYQGVDFDGDTVWYPLGGCLIDSPTESFSLTSNTLSISGTDLMMRWSKDRSGQLANVSTVIPAHYSDNGIEYKQTLRGAFLSTIERYTDIKQFYIATIPETNKYLPEDINFDAGVTVTDIFEKLLTYLPGWEIFFDRECILNIIPIPSGKDDIIYPLDSDNTNAEEISVDFSNVKNQVVVYGRTHESRYYAQNTEEEPNNVYLSTTDATNDTLNLVLIDFDVTVDYLVDNLTIEFLWLNNQYNPTLKYLTIHYGSNQTYTSPLYNFENADISHPNQLNANTFEPGSLNIIRYRADNVVTPYWDFLSNEQARAFIVQDDINSPYYINQELSKPNYYGGYSYSLNGSNYKIRLNNSEDIPLILPGTEITFVANFKNDINPTMDLINKNDSDPLESATPINPNPIPIGHYSSSTGIFTPLQYGVIGGDYTIWLLEYQTYNQGGVLIPYFEFKGRLPALVYYLSGGDYENIYSNNLAFQRAKYELYLHSNLNDSVTITTVPIYYLDVNKKISYSNFKTQTSGSFLTKGISFNIGEMGNYMVINAIRLY